MCDVLCKCPKMCAFIGYTPRKLAPGMWVVRVGGVDWELRPWHYTYVYSIESRLIIMRKPKGGGCGVPEAESRGRA